MMRHILYVQHTNILWPEKDVLGDKFCMEASQICSLEWGWTEVLKFIHAFLSQRKVSPECSPNQFLFMATQEGEKILLPACVTENEMSQPMGNDSFLVAKWLQVLSLVFLLTFQVLVEAWHFKREFEMYCAVPEVND